MWCFSNSVSIIFHNLGGTIYSINKVYNPQLPVYPQDFRCYTITTTLLSCVLTYSTILSPTSEVGINCAPQTMRKFLNVSLKLEVVSN